MIGVKNFSLETLPHTEGVSVFISSSKRRLSGERERLDGYQNL